MPVFLALFSVGNVVGGGARPWADKVAAEWTLDDAEAVLWKSPWVAFDTYRFFGTRFREREAYFYVRIQSARPIRLALAKAYRMQPEPNVVKAGPVDQKDIEKVAEGMHLRDELVLSLICFPPSFHRRLNELGFAELTRETYLEVGKHHIPLKGYVAPDSSPFGEAWFRFVRPSIDSASVNLRFVTTVKVPQRVKLEVAFDPAKLIFEDRVEY